MLLLSRIGAASRAAQPSRVLCRAVSTLPNNPHIKVFPDSLKPNTHILTLLDSSPPAAGLAIGTTTVIPPTPQSFSENPRFLSILNAVLAQNAHLDEGLRAQAKAFASPGAGSLSPGASAGSSSVSSGWVHLSDERNPPDFGRIAWPEDILGSVEVDDKGNPMDNFQPSGTYRIVTNEGILGLSPFLIRKLTQRLKEEEATGKTS